MMFPDLPQYPQRPQGEGHDADADDFDSAPAFHSSDPQTEMRAEEGITVDPMDGGLCWSCSNLTGTDQCHGFGGPLTVDCAQIGRCTQYRKMLGLDAPSAPGGYSGGRGGSY